MSVSTTVVSTRSFLPSSRPSFTAASKVKASESQVELIEGR
jgi:hypothetical protein